MSPLGIFILCAMTVFVAVETSALRHSVQNSPEPSCDPSYGYRSFDGSCNNLQNPRQGAVGSRFLHGTYKGTSYSRSYDAQGNPPTGPSARLISNKIFAAAGLESLPSKDGISATHVFWGQFLDHDLTFTATDSADQMPIPVPDDDPYIAYYPEGHRFMNFSRSKFVLNPDTGLRDQFNGITSYIDGSSVYGSTPALTRAVRLGDDICELNTTASPNGPMLPRNYLDVGYDNPAHHVPRPYLFAAGDVRANENPGLTTLHTIFVREHNRQCGVLAKSHPTASGAERFQMARKWVIALLQHVTFSEYIPATIGGALPEYTGYKEDVDATVDLMFATALFRYGHSEVLTLIPRRDEEGNPIPQGDLQLKNCYFNPLCWEDAGPEPILNGMTRNVQMEVDAFYVDAIRNFLFGNNTEKGIDSVDLGARNIQRGRDHGIPSYNKAREYFQLPAANSFADVTSNASLAAALEAAYDGDINKLDVYVGALAEDHKSFSYIGDLMGQAIEYQYTCSRDGDRFYYENTAVSGFTPEEIAEIKNTKLSTIVLRNTNIQKIPCSMMYVSGEMCGPATHTPITETPTTSKVLLNGRYNVSWTITPAEGKTAIDGDAVIEFDIFAKSNSWVGFGLNVVGDRMPGSDVYINMFYENATNRVDDYKIGGNRKPSCADNGVCPDTNQGCTNDILSSSAVWAPGDEGDATGTTHFKFSRKLVTGDKCDFPITPGTINAVAAMGGANNPVGVLKYHGEDNRVPFQVVFYGSDAPAYPPSSDPIGSPPHVPTTPVAPTPSTIPGHIIYSGSETMFDGYEVKWKIVSFNPAATTANVKQLDPLAQIWVEVEANTNTWAGFGWNNQDLEMEFSDVYVAIVGEDGLASVNDYKIGTEDGLTCAGKGPDKWVCPDVARGCTNDILESFAQYFTPDFPGGNGTLKYSFKRRLVTGDVKCDFDVIEGPMNVMSAMGKINQTQGVITSHGKYNKKAKVMTLMPSTATPAAPSTSPPGTIPAPTPFSPSCPKPLASEYPNTLSLLGSNYHLFWKGDLANNVLHVAMMAKTSGWVGLGVATETGKMVGSEAIIGWPGQVQSYLLKAKRVSEIVPNPDIPLTMTCSVEVKDDQGATWTLVRATRSLTTGANRINVTEGGLTKLVVAHGPDGANHLVQHEDDAMTRLEIPLFPTPGVPIDLPPTANSCPPPSANEFAHKVDLLENRYSLHWRAHPVDSVLDLALVAQTTGWVGFGISTAAGGMVGSEAIIGWPGSVNSYKLDAKKVDKMPNMNSIIPLSNTCSAQFVGPDGKQWTVVRASRNIVKGVNPISLDGMTPVVVAMGPPGADYLVQHPDDDKTKVQVDFMNGLSKSGKANPSHIAHGALMFISWGIIIQFGSFFARYAKPLPNALWFKVHRIVQFVGFGIAVSGFILAIVMTSGRHFATPTGHAQMGLTVMILGIVQIAVAIFRPNPAAVGQNKSIVRVLWEFSHWWVGRLALILAVATIFLGLVTIKASKAFTIAWAVIVAISCLVIALLELYRKFAIDRPQQAYEFVKLSTTDTTN